MDEEVIGLKLVVAILTKFDSDGKMVIDDEYGKFVEALIKNGVDSIMVCGTNGEFHAMSVEERKELMKFFFENFSKVEVIPHVGTPSLKETVELAKFAFERGAKVVSVVAPYYFRYDEDAIVDYYVSLSKIFPEGKFLMYNIPSLTGNELTLSIVRRVKEKAENFVGMKDSDNRPWIVSQLKSIENFEVYGGFDKVVVDYVVRGANGHVSGTANVFPKLLRAILDAVESKDYERAIELQKTLDEIVDNISGHVAFVGANKYALKVLGYDVGYPRKPSRELKDEEKKKIEEFLERVREWAI